MNITLSHYHTPGSPSLQAAYPPNKKQGAAKNDTVNFSVSSQAYPLPDFEWAHVHSNGIQTTLPGTNTGNNSTLTLENIDLEDFGNYSVVARNYIGEWEDVVFLLIPEGKSSLL